MRDFVLVDARFRGSVFSKEDGFMGSSSSLGKGFVETGSEGGGGACLERLMEPRDLKFFW